MLQISFKRTSVVLILFLTLKMFSNENDVFANLNYSEIFNQEDIYKKYSGLLQKLGCAENVFPKESSIKNHNPKELLIDNSLDIKKEIQTFEQECFSKLNNARWYTLKKPLMKEIFEIIKLGAMGIALSFIVGKDSLGGSESIAAIIPQSMFSVISLVKAINILFNLPDNPFSVYEDHFAKNKCYIPKVLWPKIIRTFAMLRRDEFSQAKYIQFLEFVLSFTIYKPKPEIKFKDKMTIEDIKKELNRRIDNFFNDYKNIDIQSLIYIKLNLTKFIDSLINKNGQAIILQSRYIHLHGTYGIGKTHFVQTLSEWIEELIPNSVLFENMIINSNDELEGNSEKAGAFLKVYRKQLLEKKHGSIIIIDEASWLNNPEMICSAKRIFNGDRTKLTTTYFGTEIDGSGVNLEIPPMLVFVTSNENIKEAALESRFDSIMFPDPNEKSLIEYAYKLISESEILKTEKKNINFGMIDNWINNLEEKNKNFRFIQSNIEAFILTKLKID